MSDYEEAMELLEKIKQIAVDINDERKIELLKYIQETLQDWMNR